MINTEIYSYQSCNNHTCFDEVLKMVNELIKDQKIKKEDIVEYHTENFETEKAYGKEWTYRVVISWWK